MINADHPELAVKLDYSATKNTPSGGYDEQWQRQLEKAYFEKQVAAMRSEGDVSPARKTAVAEESSARTSNQRATQGSFQGKLSYAGALADQSTQSSPFLSPSADRTPASRLVPSTTLSSLKNELPTQTLLRPYTVVVDGVKTDSVKAGGVEGTYKAVSKSLDLAFAGVLPTPSSVKAWFSKGAVRLVIRDSSLSSEQVLRLLNRLQELVEVNKQRLGSIMLNGQIIWQEQDIQGLTATEDEGVLSRAETRKGLNEKY